MSVALKFPKVVKKTQNVLDLPNAIYTSCRMTAEGIVPALATVKYADVAISGVTHAFYSEGTGRFFLRGASSLYASANGVTFSRLGTLAGDSPFMVEEIYQGVRRAVVIGGSVAFAHTGASYLTFSYGANLSCGVMHCGRLFGADAAAKNTLRWSGEGGVSDWTEGLYGSGSVSLDPARGDILDILEFGEKLVLVRRYGLTLIRAFGAPENFAAETTNTDTDEVIAHTAGVVGGKLLFCTVSGLHVFDGTTVTEAVHRYSSDLTSPSFAAVYAGRYLLQCYSKSGNTTVLLCYDPIDGESYRIPVSADGICIADAVYLYSGGAVYRLVEGEKVNVVCDKIDFGTGRNKTVTEIYTDGDGIDIEIGNGKTTKTFRSVGGRVRPNLRGRRFTVKATGNGPVGKLSVTAEASLGI